ncbi:MAG: glycosyltransferase [Bacteroidales bacterium]|nr:glycosyltransferase [Candidatus Liminaster caballi]
MLQDIWFSLPVWLQIVCIVFLAAWFVQLVYLLIVRRRPLSLLRAEKKGRLKLNDEQPGVTVVVYAHNQSDDLLRNLPVLFDNDYPFFDVVVVDDGSTDDTEDVLKQMDQRSEHFQHTTIDEKVRTVSHRKLAMMLGVKASHNDYIIMTQAQCVPASPKWISSVMSRFVPGVDVVMSPVVYESRTGIMNHFYQWDYFDRLITMLGLTSAVKAYGGWSSNLAFRKEVFFANKNQAFSRHLDLHPGEDDLFVNCVARKGNVAVACSPDSLLVNQLQPLRYGWSKDRLKRAFTARYYFLAPCVVRHIDIFSRYVCVLTGLACAGVAAWLQNWWVMGAALALLLIHALLVVLIPYYTAKRLGIHRFFFSPLLCALLTPMVDACFSMKANLNTKQFYVGRI